jgi:hypothetical protein
MLDIRCYAPEYLWKIKDKREVCQERAASEYQRKYPYPQLDAQQKAALCDVLAGRALKGLPKWVEGSKQWQWFAGQRRYMDAAVREYDERCERLESEGHERMKKGMRWRYTGEILQLHRGAHTRP